MTDTEAKKFYKQVVEWWVEDYDIIDNVHIKCDTKVIQCLG